MAGGFHNGQCSFKVPDLVACLADMKETNIPASSIARVAG